MSPAFADTVGLLAIWDRTDQWHVDAVDAFNGLNQRQVDLLTTTYVLAECANAAARKPYRLKVADLRDRFEAAGTLIHPTDQDWRDAWQAYRKGEAGGAGMVDLLSIAVMRRLNLVEAFTNDRHFRAAGMVVLF